jgi:hypothetical protein
MHLWNGRLYLFLDICNLTCVLYKLIPLGTGGNMFTCQDIQDQLQPGIEYEDLLKIWRKDYSSLRFLLILHFFSGILISFAELLQIFITYGDWR